MTTNSHKRGDTFDYSDQLAMTIDGAPVTDFTGMVGASQIRTPAGALVAELVFTWLDAFERNGWASLGRARNFDWMHFEAAT